MTLAPGRSDGSSEPFQFTLQITGGFSTGLRRGVEDVVLLEIEDAQVELCRGLRERAMIDHPVSARFVIQVLA